MTSVRLLPLALLASLLASCAGSGRIDTSKPIDPNEVIARVTARNARIRAISGHGRMTVDTPELANTGAVSVKLIKPDSLLLEVSGPFGMGVAKGFMTRASFTFYNGLENTVYEGATTAKNLRSVLRMSIAFADILDILTGSVGFDRVPPAASREAALEGDAYRIVYTDRSGSMEFDVDLATEAVKRFVRRDTDGGVLEEIAFRDFRKRSDEYLPAVVTVSRPPEEENLTLVYDRQSVNDLPMDFSFKVPASAPRVHF